MRCRTCVFRHCAGARANEKRQRVRVAIENVPQVVHRVLAHEPELQSGIIARLLQQIDLPFGKALEQEKASVRFAEYLTVRNHRCPVIGRNSPCGPSLPLKSVGKWCSRLCRPAHHYSAGVGWCPSPDRRRSAGFRLWNTRVSAPVEHRHLITLPIGNSKVRKSLRRPFRPRTRYCDLGFVPHVPAQIPAHKRKAPRLTWGFSVFAFVYLSNDTATPSWEVKKKLFAEIRPLLIRSIIYGRVLLSNCVVDRHARNTRDSTFICRSPVRALVCAYDECDN